jgi:hypothetical protein
MLNYPLIVEIFVKFFHVYLVYELDFALKRLVFYFHFNLLIIYFHIYCSSSMYFGNLNIVNSCKEC